MRVQDGARGGEWQAHRILFTPQGIRTHMRQQAGQLRQGFVLLQQTAGHIPQVGKQRVVAGVLFELGVGRVKIEFPAGACAEQGLYHLHGTHPVYQGVVDLAVQCEFSPPQTLDDVHLPQRPRPVEGAFVGAGDQRQQVVHPPGLRQAVVKDMPLGVVVIGGHPGRVGQVFRVQQLFVEQRPQLVQPATLARQLPQVIPGCIGGRLEDHQPGDVEGAVGGFYPEKARIL